MKITSALAAILLASTFLTSPARAQSVGGPGIPSGPTFVDALQGLGANVATALKNAADATGGVLTVGTSGATGCLLNTACAWSGLQQFNGGVAINGNSTAVLNSGAPAITADGYAGLEQNSATVTQGTIWTPQVAAGWFNWDNYRSVMVIPNGSTPVNTSAYGCYVLDQNAAGGTGQSGLCEYGLITSTVNNAKTWGENWVLSDALGGGVTATTGQTMVGSEIDYEVHSPHTVVAGVSLWLGGSSQPAAGTGFSCNANAIGLVWDICFLTQGGSVTTAGIIGATASSPGASIASQKWDYSVFDSGSVGHYVQTFGIPLGTRTAFEISDNILANGLIIANSATGNPVNIFPVGDSNLELDISGAGSGAVKILTSLNVGAGLTISGGGINGPSGANLSIAAAAGQTIAFLQGATNLVGMNNGGMYPITDNSLPLGVNGNSWSSVYSYAYFVGGVAGVTCSAGFSATTGRSVNGIITHC